MSNNLHLPSAIFGPARLQQVSTAWSTRLDHKATIIVNAPKIHALADVGRGPHRAFNFAAFLFGQSPGHNLSLRCLPQQLANRPNMVAQAARHRWHLIRQRIILLSEIIPRKKKMAYAAAWCLGTLAAGI
jgi:hypothetical protein